MHHDLVFISNVWSADSLMDRLRAEHEALASAVRARIEEVAALDAAILASTGARDKLATEARANDRELEGYVEKRDRTRKMIDTGAAPDYAAAERQLAQCLAIVDQLETKALELMESVDSAKATLARAQADRTSAGLRLDESRRALGARDAPIRAELTAAMGRQKEALAELPADLRVPYSEIRRKKRPALVNVVDGVCSHCSQKVPGQVAVEVQMGKALHTCRGCGGWLLP